MGTNYYMLTDVCEHCGRGSDLLHIGKSSAGWCFALNTHPEEGIESLVDWQAAWEHNRIEDEYGRTVTPDEMLRTITERGWKGGGCSPQWYAQNCAEPGPNGLSRSKVDGRHCIAHGDGTFDLMRGDFG